MTRFSTRSSAAWKNVFAADESVDTVASVDALVEYFPETFGVGSPNTSDFVRFYMFFIENH